MVLHTCFSSCLGWATVVCFKLVWFRYQQLPRESSVCTEVKALYSHCLMSGKVFTRVEGFASSTVFLLFPVSSLVRETQSWFSLSASSAASLLWKTTAKDGHGQPWLLHKGVEGMTGGSPCARGRGDSWRKQEERGWCGTGDFEQGNCLTSTVLGRKKLIY